MSGSRAWFEKDFYGLLGVGEKASADEIKRVYKKLAQKYHPDMNPGDKASEEKFKDISEAHDVLADPTKRAEYDQVRAMKRGYAGGAPGAGWQSNVRFEDLPFDISDLFGGAFGGRGRGQQRGQDVETRARISFMQAIEGVTLPVRVGDDQFKVKVPAGVEDGARIRVRGRGGSGGGDRGDLYVAVEVEPHERFGREGRNLTVEQPVSFARAALGGKVDVPTLDGSVTLKIPAGTPSGKRMRVRGKGIANGKGIGDLLVTVTVAVPTKLNKKQKRLIEELAALENGGAHDDAATEGDDE